MKIYSVLNICGTALASLIVLLKIAAVGVFLQRSVLQNLYIVAEFLSFSRTELKKKQWERWHKRLYSHERKMIEILPQCTSFFFHENIVFYATVPIVFF
jgi:hypothetical protein